VCKCSPTGTGGMLAFFVVSGKLKRDTLVGVDVSVVPVFKEHLFDCKEKSVECSFIAAGLAGWILL
jgi:hypothetical protein